METTHSGPIRKMRVEGREPVQYRLPIGESEVELNPYIGKRIRLKFTGEIQCIECGREIKKSFNQGFCFPCFQRLAQCDQCVVRPELCHFQKGTCREPDWGVTHCMIPHTVYLSNSSQLKVGITRGRKPLTRWIDQGAGQAIELFEVRDRLDAGRLEVALKDFYSDKTNWRKMLQGEPEPQDLVKERAKLHERFDAIGEKENIKAIKLDGQPLDIQYPVDSYPEKIRSLNLDKEPVIDAKLEGIKGQYLIFDTGVINLRKYQGYRLEVSLPS